MPQLSWCAPSPRPRPVPAFAQPSHLGLRRCSHGRTLFRRALGPCQRLWQLFDLHEKECQRLLKLPDVVLPAYDQVLKCSHIFNLLDARGAISVTERVGVIARVRKLALGVAKAYMKSNSPVEVVDEVTA